MSRSFLAWIFFLVSSLVVTMLVYRVGFLNKMFLQGVNPFERTVK